MITKQLEPVKRCKYRQRRSLPEKKNRTAVPLACDREG